MFFCGIINIDKKIIINNNKYINIEINLTNISKCKEKLSIFNFLIKYNNKLKFNKDKYILFKLIEELKIKKNHILCNIIHIFGDINTYESFLEYNIFIKKLYNIDFLKFDISWKRLLIRESYIDDIINKYKIINRFDNNIISIDPGDCYIIDDAIGYKNIDNIDIISIYIPNIALWINYLNLDDELLKLKNNNIRDIESNIKIKNTLIANILKKEFFSLKKLYRHICFTIDIYIQNNSIIKIDYLNSVVYLRNNHIYDNRYLELDKMYLDIFLITKKLNTKEKYMSKITRSNSIIEYYMTLINKKISIFLKEDYIHITSPIKYLNDIIFLRKLNKDLMLI